MSRIRAEIRRYAFLAALPAALGLASGRADEPAVAPQGSADLTALADGPLHEAFLSPRRDVEPRPVAKSPPPPVVERPAVEAPTAEARWIEGYWEWDAGRDAYVWVTGTWRIPPPGRFWVNGLWRRGEDGWRRTPGFWSDRSTDRLVARKEGPPAVRPVDDPGSPPRPNCFYVPGQFVPEGDGLAWRKGFWAEAKPGWAWVPASWTRQPEGWIFQEGYWDRPLEGRGTLFAPAASDEAGEGRTSTYRPYTTVAPELYGQLYGAFGRASSCYDGYPGVAYDDAGRFHAFAGYGTLAPYYGYLDYPAYGGYGYPYYTSPLVYRTAGPMAMPGGALAYGLGFPYFGFGNSLLPLMAGYPIFGNLGLVGGGWGWGYPGWGMGGYGLGNVGWSGMALGTWPGFNWGTFGWSGPAVLAWPAFGFGLGFPNWTSGWGGFGWGFNGFGWGGPGWAWGGVGFPGGVWGGSPPIWAAQYPFPNSGRREAEPPRLVDHRPGGIVRPDVGGAERPGLRSVMRPGPVDQPLRGRGGMRSEGVQPPPSTRPFAALLEPGERRVPVLAGGMRTGPAVERPASWGHAYNGVPPIAATRREAARPAFANNAAAGAEAATLGRMRRDLGRADGAGAAVATPEPGPMRQAGPGSIANTAGFAPRMRGSGPPASTGLEPPAGLGARGDARSIGGMRDRRGGIAGAAALRNLGSSDFAPQLHAAPAPAPVAGGMGDAGRQAGGLAGMRPPGVSSIPGLVPGAAAGAVNPGGPGGFQGGSMRGPGGTAFGAPSPTGGGFVNGMRGGFGGGALGSGFDGVPRASAGPMPASGFGGGTFNNGGMGVGGFGGMRGGGFVGAAPSGGGFGGGMSAGGGFGGGSPGGGGFGGGMRGGGGMGGGFGGGGPGFGGGAGGMSGGGMGGGAGGGGFSGGSMR